jgi:hypothetical protein
MAYTEWDLSIERRVSSMETTVRDLQETIKAARPQLILIQLLGGVGGGVLTSIIAALIIWRMTH